MSKPKEDDSLLVNSNVPANTQQSQESAEEEYEDSLEYQSETVLTVMKPVSITMIFVVWAVKTITLPGRGSTYAYMAYEETGTESSGVRLFHSLVNALIFLAAILGTTVLFVILYKYRCLKLIYGWLILSSFMIIAAFGGYFMYLLLVAYNLPLDTISYSIIIWNFGIVGILAIFWHGPTKVNQTYLILISGLMAIFFTRLPEWTTFAIVAIIAIYDLFAVLCPKGPLKVLVETAQERQEPIPALLYNASVFLMMADTDSDNNNNNNNNKSPTETKPVETAPPAKRKGVKLGLGDFVFYSVLIGRAALFDMLTVFTCFVAIVTGLFFTLLLLAIFRKALPALPISIAFGLLFYFLSRMFLLPFITIIAQHQIFI